MILLAITLYSIPPYVIDGDTISVGRERVRLVQINTPEVGECYYWESREFTEKMISKGPIRLERDIKLDNRDVYGRALRYVYVGETNLNLELVRQGYARPMLFNGVKGKYATLINKYARQARVSRLGLWRC